jgi:serine/threonine-protein phosphatase PGAM5
MRLFLIRHGSTELINGELRLSEKGVSQSKRLSNRLKEIKINKIYTSTSIRSRETVEIYTRNFIEDERLKEVYRTLIGGPKKEGTSKDRKRIDKKRADEFFNQSLKEKGNIAIFCHGNIIRYFLNKILKSNENLWEKMAINNCSISIISNDNGKKTIEGINLKNDLKITKYSNNKYSEN